MSSKKPATTTAENNTIIGWVLITIALALIALKITGQITWSWWLVLITIWVPIAAIMILTFITLIDQITRRRN